MFYIRFINNIEPRNMFQNLLSGIDRWPGTAALLLLPVPDHIPGHHPGKPAHCPGCHLWLPPPHVLVLLSCHSVLYWHLFKHSHNPKDAGEHPSTESAHLLHRLSHPDLLHPDFRCFGKFSTHSNGLWPLCGHLSPFDVHSHHESLPLWVVYSTLLVHYHCGRSAPQPDGFVTVLLHRLGNPLLLLWVCSGHQARLFWFFHQYHPG